MMKGILGVLFGTALALLSLFASTSLWGGSQYKWLCLATWISAALFPQSPEWIALPLLLFNGLVYAVFGVAVGAVLGSWIDRSSAAIVRRGKNDNSEK